MAPRIQAQTQTETTRLLKAADKAGLKVHRLEAEPGKIVLYFDNGGSTPPQAVGDHNEWDDVK
jgi:hypothetical protein